MKIGNYNESSLKTGLWDNKKKISDMIDSTEDLENNKIINKDKVFISDEAKKLLDEEELIKKYITENETEMFKDMLKQIKESSNRSNNPYSAMIKCIQISTRIINGDKVPIKDEQFLMENEPKMYTSAIMLRQHKESPKKHDSLLEDEKEKDHSLSEVNNSDSISVEKLPAVDEISKE